MWIRDVRNVLEVAVRLAASAKHRPVEDPDDSALVDPWFHSPRAVAVAWWTVVALSVCLFAWFGYRRWFHADDFSYIIFRDPIQLDGRAAERLLTSHNGHPVAVPALQFAVTTAVFGLGSYIPFASVSILLHVATVSGLRSLIIRSGVHQVTATVVCLPVLITGVSTEFPNFAAISSYQYSILALVVTMLLLEHFESGSWQMYLGIPIGIISVMSSAFGALFLVGVALSCAARRRWRDGIVLTAPAAVVFLWWYVRWGGSTVDEARNSGFAGYVVELYRQVFRALTAPGLPTIAAAATVVALIFLRREPSIRNIVAPLAITSLLAFVVIGSERSGLGTDTAAVGRYIVVGTFLVAPALAAAIDSVRMIDKRVWIALLAIIVLGLSFNVRAMRTHQQFLIDATTGDRQLLELLAGSDDLGALDPEHRPSRFSPDIRLKDFDRLIELDALEPRQPQTADESQMLAAALASAPRNSD